MRAKVLIIIEVLIISLFITLPVKAANLDEIMPKEFKNIVLEMNYTDFKLIHPDVKEFGDTFEAIICALNLSNDEIWDGSLLVFKKGKLKRFSLMRQKTDSNINIEEYFNIDQKVIPLLGKLIKIFGRKFTPKIDKKLDNIIYYEPMIIWKYGKNEIILSHTPQKFVKETRNPCIILTISSEDENISELKDFTYDQVIFNDILSENIKKMLYDSNEVKLK